MELLIVMIGTLIFVLGVGILSFYLGLKADRYDSPLTHHIMGIVMVFMSVIVLITMYVSIHEGDI